MSRPLVRVGARKLLLYIGRFYGLPAGCSFKMPHFGRWHYDADEGYWSSQTNMLAVTQHCAFFRTTKLFFFFTFATFIIISPTTCRFFTLSILIFARNFCVSAFARVDTLQVFIQIIMGTMHFNNAQWYHLWMVAVHYLILWRERICQCYKWFVSNMLCLLHLHEWRFSLTIDFGFRKVSCWKCSVTVRIAWLNFELH